MQHAQNIPKIFKFQEYFEKIYLRLRASSEANFFYSKDHTGRQAQNVYLDYIKHVKKEKKDKKNQNKIYKCTENRIK